MTSPSVKGSAATASQPSARPLAGARQLIEAATGSFGLSIANMLATILATVLLARILGVTDYGTYAFVVATVTLLAVPAVLGADRLVIRDVAVYSHTDSFGLARGLIIRSTELVLAVSTAIALLAMVITWFGSGRTVDPALAALWIGLAALPIVALVRLLQSVLMGLSHVVAGQSADLLVRPVSFLLLIVGGYLVFDGQLNAQITVVLYVTSVTIACVASLFMLRARAPHGLRNAVAEYRTRDWAVSAFALGFLSGAAIVNTQTGVVLTGLLSGPDAAGLYSVAQRGALLVAFPLAAVGTATAPMAARLWASHDRAQLQRLVTLGARGAFVASLPIGLGFILFGEQILTFLFGPDFAAAAPALTILTIGQVVNAATGSVSVLLVMTGNQRLAALGVTFGAAINIGIGLLLIPSTGVTGAAIAAASSLVVSNVLLVVLLKRTLGVDSTALGAGADPR